MVFRSKLNSILKIRKKSGNMKGKRSEILIDPLVVEPDGKSIFRIIKVVFTS